MIFRRRKCGRPPYIKPSVEELASVVLPPRENVYQRLDNVIKDESIRKIVKEIVDAIYQLPQESDFMLYLKTNAIRYKIYQDPEAMTDYMLVMTLSFIDYCAQQIYGGSTINLVTGKLSLEKLKDIKEKQCVVIASIFQEIRGQYTANPIPKRKIIPLAYKWKRETGKIVKLWDNIESNWCKK